MARRANGFTLVELMITVVVLAVLALVAIPAFQEVLAKRRLEGVANELSADLQYARTQAVADNTTVTLTTTSTTSYTITGNQTYKTVTLGQGSTVTNGVTIAFLPLRGCTNATCSAPDVSIDIANSGTTSTLQVRVNNMGRVQLCTPGGSFGGYSTCS